MSLSPRVRLWEIRTFSNLKNGNPNSVWVCFNLESERTSAVVVCINSQRAHRLLQETIDAYQSASKTWADVKQHCTETPIENGNGFFCM